MKETVSYRDLALTAYGRMKQFVEFFATFKQGSAVSNLKAAMLVGDLIKSVEYMEHAIKALDDQEDRRQLTDLKIAVMELDADGADIAERVKSLQRRVSEGEL